MNLIKEVFQTLFAKKWTKVNFPLMNTQETLDKRV